jgi:dihydroorotate dehydrogenase electron transfer subunit
MWLESPEMIADVQPGQFVMVRCGEDSLLRRPLSIHSLSAETSSRFSLLFRVIGKGTYWLSRRETGDRIDMLGLFGNGYTVHPNSRNVLLVAGGIGVAPLYLLAQHALRRECSVTLLLGASIASHLYPTYLLPAGVEVLAATEDGTVGHRGVITDILPDYAGWADQVFACGPVQMYRTMALNRGQLLDGKPLQVSLEVRMGCGRGVCYSCTIKTKDGLKQVCLDGPVFDLNDVLWDELNLS